MRPLTVADRVPQVGDVIKPPASCRFDSAVPIKAVEIGISATQRVPRWVYAFRADGGPVTVEEP